MTVGGSHMHPEPINGRELAAYEYSEAGLASGIATRCLIQPFDVLKIRFQLQEEPLRGKTRGKYNGILQSIKLIWKEEGGTAFWKGHIPAQGLSAIYGVVQFTTFEELSHKMQELQCLNNHTMSRDFLCGALAGCTAMTTAMPLDVIRTRLVAQGNPKIYRGTFHAIVKIWKMEKVPGFFRGLVPSLAQIAPYTGLQFSCYRFLIRIWGEYIKGHESTGALMSGAVAGTFAKTVLYPLDLVRHRLQVNSLIRGNHFGKTSQHRGMIRTMAGVIRREGIFGLFKGLWPSMIKAGANSGFAFLFYELACDLIRTI
ncbi:mitochondrial carrier protein [Ditylenchus destructor]|nr:mitochondrial carrier protein [Ditylenchus destructor]